MEEKLIIYGKKETLVYLWEDIIYLKAEGRYTKIVTKTESTIICKNLKIFEKKLEDSPFFRVNKTYMVNTRKISKIIGKQAYVDHIIIPVARDKIKVLKNKLK